jgi:ribonuclease HII
MRTLGIDEAGRGCVLGALYVGAWCSHAPDDLLRAAGAADSKSLSPARRAAVLERLGPLGQADVRAIPATAIDEGNLNALEEAVIVELIVAHRPDRVLLDALGHPRALPGVVDRLTRAARDAGHPTVITCEPKADARWPAVGAASIAAKVARDAALAELAATWGAIGSGYPSDPTTRAWLAARAASGQGWPEFVRTRWGTIRALHGGGNEQHRRSPRDKGPV